LLDTKTFEKPYFDLREDNIHVLDYQLFEMFEKVKSMGGMNPYPKPVYRNSENRTVVTDTEAYLEERVPVSDVEMFNPGNLIPHPGGFDLQVLKSNIDHPESGYGVFTKGDILPGTVVALYPGTVYFANNLTSQVVENNEYMISRYDDVVIDGRSWDRKQEVATRQSLQLEHVLMKTKNLNRFRNPYAIGQYINHPPPGVLPNLMSYSYDFPIEFPSDLESYIPYEYSSPPSFLFKRAETIMHSILLITTRKINLDEELFLNYRYNPTNPYPEWYSQPSPEEAQRRWGQTRIL
jgi:hypothetical protein